MVLWNLPERWVVVSTCAFLFLHNSNSRICMKNIAVEIPVKGPMMIELSWRDNRYLLFCLPLCQCFQLTFNILLLFFAAGGPLL